MGKREPGGELLDKVIEQYSSNNPHQSVTSISPEIKSKNDLQ